MKRTITLTESDLHRIIREVIAESMAFGDVNQDKIYDIYVTAVNNNREIYRTLRRLSETLAKHIKRGEKVTLEKLANSSVMDRIVHDVIEIYNNIPSVTPVRVNPAERKELRMWTSSNVFHMLDEMELLSDDEVREFEESPYFSIA